MNKKQIEARIKMEANNIEIPDLKQQILAQVPNREVIVKKEKKAFGSFGIRFSYIMSIFIIVLLAIVMFNNVNSQPQDEVKTDNTQINPPTALSKDITNTEKAYAKGAATMAGFVEGMDSGIEGLAATVNLLSQNMTDYKAMAEEINRYFSAVSRLLDEDGAVYKLETLENSQYMYKLTITNKVLSDTFETVIYYNEEALDKNNTSHKTDEISTTLSGKIIQSGKEYYFEGFKELEQDECNIELTLKIDEYNYLTVCQEIETNEKEYEYIFHTGDKKRPYKTIEIEIEADENDKDGKKDVSIEIEENGREIEIEFKYGKDKDYVDVKYHHEYDDDYDDFKIRENENDKNQYRFDFKDKSGNDRSENLDKKHKGHKND